MKKNDSTVHSVIRQCLEKDNRQWQSVCCVTVGKVTWTCVCITAHCYKQEDSKILTQEHLNWHWYALQLHISVFHLRQGQKGSDVQLPPPSAPTSDESFQAIRPVKSWKTFIAPRPNSIMCTFIPGCVMHRGVCWPPRLTNFAVRLCAVCGRYRRSFLIRHKPPKAIYLSKVRRSWVMGCVRAPDSAWNHQSLCTHTRACAHTHTHTGSLFI